MFNIIFKFNDFRHLLKFYNIHNLPSSCKINCRSYSNRNYLTNLLLKMPKDNTHTVVLKSQRIKGKAKNMKYTPGTVILQVLGSGAKGAPRSLYVFTDHSRYLFNCGEGTQRLAHEHKMKLSKLEHIFITHSSWENVGGLPGVALTIQDVGVPEIILHGPECVDEIFSATRRFVILKNLEVSKVECSKEKMFEDNVLKVNYIPLKSNKPKHVTEPAFFQPDMSSYEEKKFDSNDETDYYAHEKSKAQNNSQNNSLKRKRRLSQNSSDTNKAARTEDVSICYVCRLQPRPGALCLEKCIEMGVPPGPLLGRLKAGQDIVLDNGNIVRSSDVTLPDDPGPLFIVIEVPSEDFLPALENEESFAKYQSSASNPENVAFLVVHFTPPHIIKHPKYIEFMKKFPISCTHLLLNEDNECMGSLAVHRIQYKLNLLDQQMFPLLADTSIPIVSKSSQVAENNHIENCAAPISESIYGENGLCVSHGKTLWKASLRPQRFLKSGDLAMDPSEYMEEVTTLEGFPEELEKLKDNLSSIPEKDQEYPNLVFLGTGSCIPNKTRNTSAILVNLSESASMMLDCGEGSWGQLYRFYGREKTAEILSRLKAVYISHLHADHHIGLIGLLKAISDQQSSSRPLYLIAPGQIAPWLTLYHKRFENILDSIRLIPNSFLAGESNFDGISDDVKEILNLSNLVTCPVSHCPNAFGLAVTHRSGWKITYSGDTMPCDALVEIGAGSDLLIHEATMEDELMDEAKIKLHSTTSQAIESGKRMGAKYTLLTHFSQRYAKLPRFNDSFTHTVGIAFDNMRVRLSDLSKIPLLYPALRIMFQEDYDELEMKAFKRQLKQTVQQQTITNAS